MTDSTRYVPTGTRLTEHEREILTILMEEACEVAIACSKMIRFGKENRPDSGVSNSRELGLEIGDFQHMVARVRVLDLVVDADIYEGQLRKRERLSKYLQTEAGRKS